VSAKNLGRDVAQIPDLAFVQSVDIVAASRRDVVVLSFRNDTRVEEDSLKPLVRWCVSQGIKVMCVSQVRRDDEQHSQLAVALNIEPVLWGSRSHAEHEEVIRDVYGKSVAVISNRLHALLLGAICGASPVEYRVASSDKIQTTLTPWLTNVPVLHSSTVLTHNFDDMFSSLSPERLKDEVARARIACRQAVSEASAMLA
jgi:exopolysaccharide biosynthesis predicted pyruvyltransferase EpsI